MNWRISVCAWFLLCAVDLKSPQPELFISDLVQLGHRVTSLSLSLSARTRRRRATDWMRYIPHSPYISTFLRLPALHLCSVQTGMKRAQIWGIGRPSTVCRSPVEWIQGVIPRADRTWWRTCGPAVAWDPTIQHPILTNCPFLKSGAAAFISIRM